MMDGEEDNDNRTHHHSVIVDGQFLYTVDPQLSDPLCSYFFILKTVRITEIVRTIFYRYKYMCTVLTIQGINTS